MSGVDVPQLPRGEVELGENGRGEAHVAEMTCDRLVHRSRQVDRAPALTSGGTRCRQGDGDGLSGVESPGLGSWEINSWGLDP